MVTVRKIRRKSAVLSPSSLACLSQIPTVNLTMGCAHGCLYCYTRGYRAYPGEGKLDVYENTLEKLQAELARKRQKPDAIYFSPASDLFQPVPDVLDMAYEVIRYLLANGVGIAFLTKGIIPEKHMSLLLAHPSHVRAQIGLIATDDAVLRAFEPNAAPAKIRIEQMKRLTHGGIKTQLRIDPILPGLTDDAETFDKLCRIAAACDVKRIAASALFLRSAPMRRLAEAAKTSAFVTQCLAQFNSSERIAIHAERSSVMALPAAEREAIFRRLEEVAARYGIVVKRCACKNPDIATGTCSIAGEWQHRATAAQTGLFQPTGGAIEMVKDIDIALVLPHKVEPDDILAAAREPDDGAPRVILEFFLEHERAKEVNLALDLIAHRCPNMAARSDALVQLARSYLAANLSTACDSATVHREPVQIRGGRDARAEFSN